MPTKAEARCYGCWVGAAVLAGLIGSAIIANRAYGYYGPAYYGPAYYPPAYYGYAPYYYRPRIYRPYAGYYGIIVPIADITGRITDRAATGITGAGSRARASPFARRLYRTERAVERQVIDLGQWKVRPGP